MVLTCTLYWEDWKKCNIKIFYPVHEEIRKNIVFRVISEFTVSHLTHCYCPVNPPFKELPPIASYINIPSPQGNLVFFRGNIPAKLSSANTDFHTSCWKIHEKSVKTDYTSWLNGWTYFILFSSFIVGTRGRMALKQVVLNRYKTYTTSACWKIPN